MDFVSHILLVYASIESIQHIYEYSTFLHGERRKEKNRRENWSRISPIWRSHSQSENNKVNDVDQSHTVKQSDGENRMAQNLDSVNRGESKIKDSEEETVKGQRGKPIHSTDEANGSSESIDSKQITSSNDGLVKHFESYRRWHIFWFLYFALKQMEVWLMMPKWCPLTYSFIRLSSLIYFLFFPSFSSSLIFRQTIDGLYRYFPASMFFSSPTSLQSKGDTWQYNEKSNKSNGVFIYLKDSLFLYLPEFCINLEIKMDNLSNSLHKHVLHYFYLALFYLMKFLITLYHQNEDACKAVLPSNMKALLDLFISQIVASSWYSKLAPSASESKSKSKEEEGKNRA